MIDFHSHILPGMDDGAQDPTVSFNLLKTVQKQGVTTVVASSHYYGEEESVDSFLRRRSHAYETLQQTGLLSSLPEIRLGCEVHLSEGLCRREGLERLCIQGTDVILLEMPYEIWQPWLLESIYYIIAVRRLRPVIAHLDRYREMLRHAEMFHQLLSMDLTVQLNADAFCGFFFPKTVRYAMASGKPIVLGSDMHNMTARPPYMEKAAKAIRKRYGEGVLSAMNRRAEELLSSGQAAEQQG